MSFLSVSEPLDELDANVFSLPKPSASTNLYIPGVHTENEYAHFYRIYATIHNTSKIINYNINTNSDYQ